MSFLTDLLTPLMVILFAAIAGVSLLFFLYFLFKLFLQLPSKFKQLGWQFLLSLAMVFIFLGITSYVTAQNTVCLACHKTTGLAKEHRTLSCLSCHQESGFSGALVFRLKEAKMFLLSANIISGNVNICISNLKCIACHQNVTSNILKSKNIKVRHIDFQEIYDCISCHFKSVHTGRNETGARMEKCSFCHQKDIKDQQCSVCHEKKVVAKLETNNYFFNYLHGSNWLLVHGQKNIEMCSACHKDDSCKRCHSSFPHGKAWPALHSRVAKNGMAECLRCHSLTTCDDCHGIEMPHPNNWMIDHGWKSKTEWAPLCSRCHVRNNCLSCHQKEELVKELGKGF